MSNPTLNISNTSTAAQRPSIREVTPVVAVVSAVVEVAGEDPMELPPVNNVINADALNELVASDRHNGLESVSFEYAGYSVDVTGNGDVTVASDA